MFYLQIIKVFIPYVPFFCFDLCFHLCVGMLKVSKEAILSCKFVPNIFEIFYVEGVERSSNSVFKLVYIYLFIDHVKGVKSYPHNIHKFNGIYVHIVKSPFKLHCVS